MFPFCVFFRGSSEGAPYFLLYWCGDLLPIDLFFCPFSGKHQLLLMQPNNLPPWNTSRQVNILIWRLGFWDQNRYSNLSAFNCAFFSPGLAGKFLPLTWSVSGFFHFPILTDLFWEPLLCPLSGIATYPAHVGLKAHGMILLLCFVFLYLSSVRPPLFETSGLLWASMLRWPRFPLQPIPSAGGIGFERCNLSDVLSRSLWACLTNALKTVWICPKDEVSHPF